jgi:DNA polymerase III subunit epsilon
LSRFTWQYCKSTVTTPIPLLRRFPSYADSPLTPIPLSRRFPSHAGLPPTPAPQRRFPSQDFFRLLRAHRARQPSLPLEDITIELLDNLRLTRPLAVIDLETTGTAPRRNYTVEIAVVKILPCGNRVCFHRRVNPGMPIPAAATAVHGITDEDVASCSSFTEIALRLADFLTDCGLAGFNLKRFDLPFLFNEFAQAEVDFSLAGRSLIDVLEIYHQREPRTLTAAVRLYLDRPHDGAHGAQADAWATAAILDAQLGRYRDLPRTVPELHAGFATVDVARRLRRNDWGRVVFSFGKYTDMPLDEVAQFDPSYLRWLLEQDFLPDFLELIQQALHYG